MNRILPIVFIVIALGLFVLYVNPTYTGSIAQAKQQIASYNKALTASKAFTQKEANLQTQMKAIAPSDLQRLETFLPDDVDNIQLILDLNGLASRSGLTLSNFSIQSTGSDTGTTPATSAPAPGIGGALPSSSLTNSVAVSVSATGPYSAFTTFISGAEQSLRPLDITALTVTGSSDSNYTYTITFRLYWLQ